MIFYEIMGLGIYESGNEAFGFYDFFMFFFRWILASLSICLPLGAQLELS